MDNFFKTSFYNLFTEKSGPDFCVLVIEHKKKDGHPSSREVIATIHRACQNLLSASYVVHFTEIQNDLIFCYLNYDSTIFSTRAFVGSLRQIIYNITPEANSTVYFSGAVKTMAELSEECSFLARSTDYSAYLGFSAPVTSEYLHECVSSLQEPLALSFNYIYDNLIAKNYEEVIQSINDEGDRLSGLVRDGIHYSSRILMQYSCDVWYAVRLYFISQNCPDKYFDKNITEELFINRGIGRLFKTIANQIADFRDTFASSDSTTREQQQTDAILEYISNNLATVNLNETAARFDFTPEYLSRLFKKNTGENYSEFIKRKRFEKALELLRSGEKISIAEISAMLGYKSQSHFQNKFKAEYGVSPDAYRKAFNLHHLNS